MALPEPEIGLVVRYGFVWKSSSRKAPPDAGKDRPCLIVDVRRDGPGARVTYLSISHSAPRDGDEAVVVPVAVCRHLGLDAEPCYLYTSYACEDDWPYDLARRSGSDDFDYGFIPPKLFERVAATFRRRLASEPGFPNPRSG